MTYEELYERQKWTLEQKIDHAVGVIEAFRNFAEEQGMGTYISFSGGKDSQVLLDIARRFIDPNYKAMFINTTNEFPEVVKFVKTFDNVDIMFPEMNVREVIAKYGFPLVSKEQAQYIHDCKVSNSPEFIEKRMNGTICVGTHRGGKIRTRKRGHVSDCWKPLISKPYMISNICCDKLKKRPAHIYHKKNKVYPILGVMASESRLRASAYVRRGGCNSFSGTHIASYPLSIWTEEDIWAYIEKFNLSYCPIYNYGKSRSTGCMCCGFGAYYDERFELLKELHPKQYEAFMNFTNNDVRYEDALNDMMELYNKRIKHNGLDHKKQISNAN